MASFQDLLVALVDERIAHALGIATLMYSTERPALYPPNKRTRRAARDAIRAAGGERLGTGRATVWRIDRAKYHAFHGRKPPELRLVATSTDQEIAERALARVR
jgi:hypothetical protein